MRELGWPAFLHVMAAIWLCSLGFSKHLSEKWRGTVGTLGGTAITFPYGAVTTNPVGPYGLNLVARLAITVTLYVLIYASIIQVRQLKQEQQSGAGATAEESLPSTHLEPLIRIY